MISLQTNLNSLVAQQNLNTNSIFQSKTIDQLTSGYRINSSGDDAAGLAVANKYRSSVAELTQGVANGNDGEASLQIMDGGMSNISMMLDRLKTLAMQSASGSFTGGTTGRSQLNSEFQSDITEISRQAQSIGLNQGGTFAKNLAVYLGAGSGSGVGSGSSAASNNSVVNVDLSGATVDAQSLGLQNVQATNATAYDLSASQATSVQAIVANGTNAAALASQNGDTYFTFTGPGFGDSNGIKVAVNMNGVGDTNGLIAAVNAGLQGVSASTGAGAAFLNAGITASLKTLSSGKEQLAFSSSTAAFTVQGDDVVSNALLGDFSSGGPAGLTLNATVSTAVAAAGTVTLTAQVVFTVSGGGMTAAQTFTFAAGSTVTTDLATLKAGNAALTAAGITITGLGGAVITATSSNGQGVSLVATGTSADTASVGFAATGVWVSSASSNYTENISGGAYQLGNAASSTATPLSWTNLVPSDQQAVTVSSTDSNGVSHTKTVTLSTAATGSGTGSSIDSAIDAINQALQLTDDSTLQQITAVKTQAGGVQSIQFTSTLSNFQVAVGTDAAATSGMNAGVAENVGAIQVGTGGTSDISTMTGAQAAVAAITTAVGILGTAQADVGKGENQLNFAISLAQSQITNFSAAESNIRDANVAMEAANLTKAQVLQQASIAAMAQANSAPQAVLTLLRG